MFDYDGINFAEVKDNDGIKHIWKKNSRISLIRYF